jgi:gamma-glutamyltranspeptidase/glutathione hydrolase
MVVSEAPIASRVGAEVLMDGGNAFDAAVATAFALAVVYPAAGNLGGGLFIVARLEGDRAVALDARETAPAAATRDMFLGDDGEPMEASLVGHRASAVPGSVAGLWEVHRRYGTLPWRRLVAPAIRLAADGYPLDSMQALYTRHHGPRLARDPASAAIHLPSGDPLQEGDTLRNPHLAATLRRIAERGAAGFYQGETADLLVAEMRAGGGIISHQDLEQYRPVWREPVDFDYRGHRVISMPPPSSGGLTLAITAKILEAYDLAQTGWHRPQTIHLIAEALRRAFADRNHFLGDPDFVSVPATRLLSAAHIHEHRASISPDSATPSSSFARRYGAGEEGTNTTHLSVVDGEGNMVALTTTLNIGYGSGITVTGAGFLLNNEMDDFTAKPGAPNAAGLVTGRANEIAPGKRPLSSMTPTIVLDPHGSPLLVTGGSGGPFIISGVFQVISNVVDFQMPSAFVVSAPRLHHQHLPDRLFIERWGFDPEVRASLEQLGHAIGDVGGPFAITPSLLRRGGRWYGLVDPRVGGSADGH